jgi:hypothetical protein
MISEEMERWDNRFDRSATIAEGIYDELFPALTQENCPHPTLMKTGEGSISSNGSSVMSWRCSACGKSETVRTPARIVEK